MSDRLLRFWHGPLSWLGFLSCSFFPLSSFSVDAKGKDRTGQRLAIVLVFYRISR
jgi:hypothetical protein